MVYLENVSVYVDDHPLFESCANFESLREHEDLRDLEIPVKNDEKVFAHKIVLAARIPFLLPFLNSRLRWDRQDINIHCATSIISYAYTGKLNIKMENVADIISFSKILQLEHIVNFCCEFVQPRLDTNNISTFWRLSRNEDFPSLKKYCLNFMQNQFEFIVDTPLFEGLELEDLKSIISANDLRVRSEESVFAAIKIWIQADKHPGCEEQIVDLAKCIRWGQTSSDFRSNLSANDEMVKNSNSLLKYLLTVEQNFKNSEDYFNHNPRTGVQCFLTFGEPTFGKREWIAEIYDSVSANSHTIAHLTYREWAALVSVGEGKVMIIGGDVNEKISSSVDLFSCRDRKCCSLDSLKSPRRGHGACKVDDAVIVCGGRATEGQLLNTCEIYFEEKWKPLPIMKETRNGAAVISSSDRRVYVIGGLTAVDEILSSVEVCQLPIGFTSSSPPSPINFWRSVAPMRQARYGPAATLFHGNIFVAGGYKTFQEPLSSVEMFPSDNEKAHWVSIPTSMKEKRCFHHLVVFRQGIYAFGNHLSPYNSVEQIQVGKSSRNSRALANFSHMRSSLFSRKSCTLTSPSTDLCSSHWESLSEITSMKRIWGAILIPPHRPKMPENFK